MKSLDHMSVVTAMPLLNQDKRTQQILTHKNYIKSEISEMIIEQFETEIPNFEFYDSTMLPRQDFFFLTWSTTCCKLSIECEYYISRLCSVLITFFLLWNKDMKGCVPNLSLSVFFKRKVVGNYDTGI